MCTPAPAPTPTETAVDFITGAWSTDIDPQAKQVKAVPQTAIFHRFTGPVYLPFRAARNQRVRRPFACAQSGGKDRPY
jgi:hypothetical protein